MRFIHIEDFFHPEAGYQVNLLSKLQIQQGHEVFVIAAELEKMPEYLTSFFGKDFMKERDDKFFQMTGVKIIRVPLIGYYSGRAIFHRKIFSIIKSLKPSAVLVHGLDTLTGIRFIRKVKRLDYPLVLDCHMLEMASVNRFRNIFRSFYKRFVTPYILKNSIPLIRVADSDYVEKCLGIPLKKTVLLSFGTDTEYFNKDEIKKCQFRREYNIGDNDFVAIYAGKLDIYKGGKFLAASLHEEIKISTGRKLFFIIIGNTIGEYGEEVDELFKTSKNKILRFPAQKYYDLKYYYQSADLAIYPKQCSLSFFEAQSCELPVLFEDNEINKQRSLFGNAIVFKGNDIEDFRSKIIQYAEMDESEYKKMKIAARKYICDNYNFVPIAQRFSDIMAAEVERFKNINNTPMC